MNNQSINHHFVVVRNFQRLDTDHDKLDGLLCCDDIWDEVFSSFDNVSNCLECFNLIMAGLLDLVVPLMKLRVRQQEYNYVLDYLMLPCYCLSST